MFSKISVRNIELITLIALMRPCRRSKAGYHSTHDWQFLASNNIWKVITLFYSNNDIQDNKMSPTGRLIGAEFINSFYKVLPTALPVTVGLLGVRSHLELEEILSLGKMKSLCPVTCRQLYNYLIQYLEYFSCNECLEMFSMEI